MGAEGGDVLHCREWSGTEREGVAGGGPLEGMSELDPRRCLKILALMRLVCPAKEIRVAGGRELNLRSLQPLALYAANSIFVGDYLTTEGQAVQADWAMLEDLGFEIEECAL